MRVFAIAILTIVFGDMSSSLHAMDRPNILWITSEDNGPELGCYGCPDANTPHLDALAQKSAIYRNCWSNAPVCAPARTTIITGMYCPSIGAEHMRSEVRLPADIRLFPHYLREAGYYCTNNSKEDYNLAVADYGWNESSASAHWRNRPREQPFFAVFNLTTTHESQIRKQPHHFIHRPSEVHVPGYHPDLPEVREAWAQYHDQMTEMDAQAGRIIADLDADGLSNQTIVIYFGDHGPGLPRCKRSPCHSGLHVPLILHVPEQFRALAPAGYRIGTTLDRPVSFVDLAPTMLSLVGIEPPSLMQGRAFCGHFTTAPDEFQFGYRARMDERLDLTRSVRWKNWVYVRNFMPHKTAGQFQTYMYETPMMRAWEKAFANGQLAPQHARFFEPDAPEELYNLENDPSELVNLVTAPDCQDTLKRMRQALHHWQLNVRDIVLMPEAEMQRRTVGITPYELSHSPDFPFHEMLATAERASDTTNPGWNLLTPLLEHDEPAVRYWAVMGCMLRGQDAVAHVRAQLIDRLSDESAAVRVMAAEALLKSGQADGCSAADVLLACGEVNPDPALAIQAFNALDDLDSVGIELFLRRADDPFVEARSLSRNQGDYRNRLIARLKSKAAAAQGEGTPSDQ